MGSARCTLGLDIAGGHNPEHRVGVVWSHLTMWKRLRSSLALIQESSERGLGPVLAEPERGQGEGAWIKPMGGRGHDPAVCREGDLDKPQSGHTGGR